MSKPYTDEDVEVVADLAMVAHWGDASWKDEAVTILDAVAPAIIRRAKAEALRDFADSTSTGDYGYGEAGSGWYERDAESVLDAARSMADEIEAGR